MELHRYEEALAANEQARELDPQNPNYIYNAGLIWPEVRQSTELSPGFVDGWIAWGGILARKGQWNEAAKAYERAVERDPGNGQLWYLLSVAYRKSGKNVKAERALNEFKKYRKP